MLEEKIQALLPSSLPTTIGDLPSTRSNAVAIVLYDGTANAEYFGGRQGSTITQPVVKIVVRHESYETGKSWVETIKETLHRYTDEDFLGIWLIGSPFYLGKGTQQLHEFQITFSIQVKE